MMYIEEIRVNMDNIVVKINREFFVLHEHAKLFPRVPEIVLR